MTLRESRQRCLGSPGAHTSPSPSPPTHTPSRKRSTHFAWDVVEVRGSARRARRTTAWVGGERERESERTNLERKGLGLTFAVCAGVARDGSRVDEAQGPDLR